jgi:Ca2+-transporting ATPase
MNDTFNLESGLTMLMFGVALAVAAVPEALAAIVTGALAIGMRDMAKRNAIVRKMPAVETLGCTTVICTDKTGTLTRGEMTVRKIFTGGRFIEITGAGYEPSGEFIGREGLEKPLHTLLRCGVLCNDADLIQAEDRWAIKGDPTEAALVVAAVKAGVDHAELRRASKRVSEVPFSSERKLMTRFIPARSAASPFSRGPPKSSWALPTASWKAAGASGPSTPRTGPASARPTRTWRARPSASWPWRTGRRMRGRVRRSLSRTWCFSGWWA